MATIFRQPVVVRTAALLSTTVAINSQIPQNTILLRNVEQQPLHLRDFPPPARPVLVPYVQDVRNQHVFLPAPNPQPPFNQDDWPTPDPPIRSQIVDAILNSTVRLPQVAAQVPFPFGHVDELPPAPILRPHGNIHLRPQPPPSTRPEPRLYDWPLAPILVPITVDPVRNEIIFPPPPPPTGPERRIFDWPLPKTVPFVLQPWEFYYIQDQTAPSFIQYDWPLPARTLPVRLDDPIPNRLLTLLQFVPVTVPFYKHLDWPNPEIVRRPLVQDPINESVFLPTPTGIPFYKHFDWPLPKGARSLQPEHTNDRVRFLSAPVSVPFYKHLEWPTPARVPATQFWQADNTGAMTQVLKPPFKPEWAMNANQHHGAIKHVPKLA